MIITGIRSFLVANFAVRFYLGEGFFIEDEQIDINTNETELDMKWINNKKDCFYI